MTRALLFKDECKVRRQTVGPLWWVARDEAGQISTVNYADSTTTRVLCGEGFGPQWFTLAKAKRIARAEGVPLITSLLELQDGGP